MVLHLDSTLFDSDQGKQDKEWLGNLSYALEGIGESLSCRLRSTLLF